jgi:hypothetical protein
MSNSHSSFLITKRKRSDPTPDETEQHPPEPKTKRRKISAMTSRTQGTRKEVSNATPEFPNGFFYCHQCNKKRDSSGEPALALIPRMATVLNPPSLVGLYCTYKIKAPTNSVARCKAKYCRACLKNRYGQELDEIKDRGINALSKETVGHDKGQGYIFK